MRKALTIGLLILGLAILLSPTTALAWPPDAGFWWVGHFAKVEGEYVFKCDGTGELDCWVDTGGVPCARPEGLAGYLSADDDWYYFEATQNPVESFVKNAEDGDEIMVVDKEWLDSMFEE